MVKVIERGRFRIYVYRELRERHHQTHCHIYWPDGSASVGVDPIERLAGDELPSQAIRLISEQIDAIKAAWDSVNDKD